MTLNSWAYKAGGSPKEGYNKHEMVKKLDGALVIIIGCKRQLAAQCSDRKRQVFCGLSSYHYQIDVMFFVD